MVDKKNIQGDTWPRLPKKAERFIFFRITNAEEFKNALPKIVGFITTAYTAEMNRKNIYKQKADGTLKGLVSLVSLNIAFSANGLAKLGAEKFDDDIFNGGQFKDMTAPSEGESDADHQGLDPQEDWVNEFKPNGGGIDGCLTVAGDSIESIEKMVKKSFDWVFNVGNDKQSIEIVYTKDGQVYKEHLEHFGWVDGISQPIVKGLDPTEADDGKGMTPIDPGIIFVGNEGDDSKHPAWAKDGSFMVFRIYEQLVPEFYRWAAINCSIPMAEIIKSMQETGKPPQGFTPDAMNQLALFSSRLVGRWPNGAPMELHPQEDPNWSKFEKKFQEADLKTMNYTDAFNYRPTDQIKCPYVSHMRKTGPRDDYPGYAKHVIMRRGIPYGDECELPEKNSGITQKERGLLFVCYQSSIENGFVTQQKRWANASDSPTDMAKHSGGTSQGIDPLIGQIHPSRHAKPTDGQRINPKYQDPPVIPFPDSDLEKPAPQVYEKSLTLERFVVPHGGEYFFTPSISALRDYLPRA
ncbi:uncharacterized protein N7484_008256 [Penicillium longicatenatum]|uniref:uncharacterized protein n=1 Tax=Penicillium longicatenatum TaxID=1561947 RepID=UPI0025484463|nr:uncharacterized protein N7484_008256 [Penicillium longicatenatum]KAJ5634943.1 hypothetical protein N7484_008256 [Penicillium longicatenatum]